MARAFITGIDGLALTATSARSCATPTRGASSCSRAMSRRRSRCARLVGGIARGGRARRAGADRPGGRPRAAPGAAALAELSARRRLRRALRPRPRCGARGRAARRAADRRRPRRARHRRRLPAARRRAGERGRSGDRRPRLWHDAGQGGGDRRGGRRGPDARAACCRCSSTFPAMAARPPTAITSCRWSTPTAPRWSQAISRRSGRSPKLPLGMTAHVVFSAIDPVAPATTSGTMVREVIRGTIGFDGLLMSDDMSMDALVGHACASAARAALAAGCDVVLHCNGKLDEMARGRRQRAAARRRGGAARRCGARARGARRPISMSRRRASSSPADDRRVIAHAAARMTHDDRRACSSTAAVAASVPPTSRR